MSVLYRNFTRCGDLVFTRGVVSPLVNTNASVSFEEQTNSAIDELRNILVDAGSELQHLLDVRVYLADLEDTKLFNEIYENRVPQPRPARTLVGAELRAGVSVELSATSVAMTK